MRSHTLLFSGFLFLIILFCYLNLITGSVHIPVADVISILMGNEAERSSWNFIVMESRLPQTLTALFSGAALAVSGLLLQTAFRNPLAGPSVFGISSGASLGVAIVMLLTGGTIATTLFSVSGFIAILVAAFVGAMIVTAIIFLFSTLVHNNVMLLIIGIMVGYLSSSMITLLNFMATEEGIRSYIVWGMGNFGGVSMDYMPAFAGIVTVGLVLSCLLILITGLLTAITTAFCGPVTFIGLAVPHIARLFLNTDNHRSLLPLTILTGALVALLCNFVCSLPGDHGVLPLNAVTPLVGAPVIIYVVLRKGYR